MTERNRPGSGERRALRRLLPLVLALLFAMPLAGGVATTPPVARADELSTALARQKAITSRIAQQKALIARLNGQQAALNDAIADTNTSLKAVNADLTVVKRKIDTLADRIATTRAAYAALVAQLGDLDTQLADLESQAEKKSRQLVSRQGILGDRLRAAYRTDRTSLLETLLSADSFADALTNIGYLADYANEDRRLADLIKADQATLSTLQATVADTRLQTEALRVETKAQKKQLDARLAEEKEARAKLASLQAETARRLAAQQSNYDKLAKNKAAAQKAMAQYLAAQRRLQSQISAIVARQRALGRIPSKYNGTLRSPMPGVVTQNYGCTGFSWEPPLGNCRHWHSGIDIAAPLYTPVRAAGAGRVVFAGPNPYDPYPKAWIVIIAHSGELQTWYGHLDNRRYPIPVRSGQWVTQGQVIGYEGMTGRTTGPHLHFMVELNDRFVNPRLFM